MGPAASGSRRARQRAVPDGRLVRRGPLRPSERLRRRPAARSRSASGRPAKAASGSSRPASFARTPTWPSPRQSISTLDLNLGAVDADLELGGLRLSDLTLEAGASQAMVRFSQPNRIALPHRRSSPPAPRKSRCWGWATAAATASSSRAAWARSSSTSAAGGAPAPRWRSRWRSASSRSAFPGRSGVRLTLDRFLASFDPAGLIRSRQRASSRPATTAPSGGWTST